jgi:hypothetical protein
MLSLPLEADAILIIDPDAVLAPPVSSQALEPVIWGYRQLFHLTHPIDLIELAPSQGPEMTRAHSPGCRPVSAIKNRLSA